MSTPPAPSQAPAVVSSAPHPALHPAHHGHRRRATAGRDVHESHRVSTPLELLFDLAFVVANAALAAQLHHAAAEQHLAQRLLGFAATFFAIWWACWCWPPA